MLLGLSGREGFTLTGHVAMLFSYLHLTIWIIGLHTPGDDSVLGLTRLGTSEPEAERSSWRIFILCTYMRVYISPMNMRLSLLHPLNRSDHPVRSEDGRSSCTFTRSISLLSFTRLGTIWVCLIVCLETHAVSSQGPSRLG